MLIVPLAALANPVAQLANPVVQLTDPVVQLADPVVQLANPVVEPEPRGAALCLQLPQDLHEEGGVLPLALPDHPT